jgi:hypothetical protein
MATVAAVGALWLDGKIYFTSGPRTRKSRNLAQNPRCVVSVSLKGLDLVIEGTVEGHRRRDDEAARGAVRSSRMARECERGRLHPRVQRSERGSATLVLHAVTPIKAFGVATAEPFDATRWRFEERP